MSVFFRPSSLQSVLIQCGEKSVNHEMQDFKLEIGSINIIQSHNLGHRGYGRVWVNVQVRIKKIKFDLFRLLST